MTASAKKLKAAVTAEFLTRLESIVGASDVRTDPSDRWPYSYDNSRRQALPDVVVYPNHHDEVAAIVRLCNKHRVPVTARGLGSATTGATVPLAGGVVLALERMNRVIGIDPANRTMRVEAGIINSTAQAAAGEQGFFWGCSPSSADYSTVGGNLACCAGGPLTLKYGTPRENTLGLHAVTGEGVEIRTGVSTTKGVIGYDLTRLIVGSEGTLAIITEATLKLTPRPTAKRMLRAVFRDIHAAAAAVSRLMAQPVTPSMIEFIDAQAINMIREYAETDLPADAGAMLLIEVDGLDAVIEANTEAVSEAARGEGLTELRAARDEAETKALWAARKALSPALRKIAPKKVNEDVVVPVSRMAEFIDRLTALSREFDIIIVNFGHAGNGNIHVNMLADPDNAAQMERLEPCLLRVFELVLELGGTLSGEHGVGIEKQNYVGMEIEPATLALMRKIKAQFDPNGILNPGKFFPEERGSGLGIRDSVW